MTSALARGAVGAYQLQAAIAAVHSEAPSAAETDWAEVLALYELLDRVAPNPMATVNRALAVAMVRGPEAGLDLLASLDGDARVARHHLLFAMRGHLLEMSGSPAAARGRVRGGRPADGQRPREAVPAAPGARLFRCWLTVTLLLRLATLGRSRSSSAPGADIRLSA